MAGNTLLRVRRVSELKSFRSPPVAIGIWHLFGSDTGLAFTTDCRWLRIWRILWRSCLSFLGSPREIHPPFHPKLHKYMMINQRRRFPKPLVPVQVRAGAPLRRASPPHCRWGAFLRPEVSELLPKTTFVELLPTADAKAMSGLNTRT